QGAVSTLTLFCLGLPNPLLWGLLIALLSLIPLFGAALIWVPWTIYLFVVGSIGKAVVLLVMQIVVVGTVDNVLWPLFIRGGAKMHTLIVFFSILGSCLLRYYRNSVWTFNICNRHRVARILCRRAQRTHRRTGRMSGRMLYPRVI